MQARAYLEKFVWCRASHPLGLGRVGIRLESLEVSLKMTLDEEVVKQEHIVQEVVQRAREIPGTLQQSLRATHGN